MSDCRKCASFDWCAENEDCFLFNPKPQQNDSAYAKGWENGERAAESRTPRWIPVTERLPELGETVIVYTTESLVSVRRCYLDTMVISNTTDVPYWSVFQGRVLYWMPLPEPPKEEL